MNKTAHIDFLSSLKAQDIYVGFSGGADSTALLVLLAEYAGQVGFCLHAIHFQHNLRGQESVDDSSWCRGFCSTRVIPFKEISLDVIGQQRAGEGIEAAARRLRNEHWQQMGGGEGTFVALGHHADDRAENLILRLCRGSNVTGLTSMRDVQRIENITYIRPLLNDNRNDIINFLTESNIDDWRHDSSNDSAIYKRNFVRHRILPELKTELPYSEMGIQHSLANLSADADFIEEHALKVFGELSGKKSISLFFLADLHSAILVRVLRYWLREQLGCEFLPNRRFITRLKTEFNSDVLSGEVKELPLDGDLSLSIQRGQLSVHTENLMALPVTTVEWKWRDTTTVKWNGITFLAQFVDGIPEELNGAAYFDADDLPEILTIRNWQTGDKMIPFGRNSEVKLKKIFSDKKISSELKSTYPIICTDTSIIWIPGIRRSSLFPARGSVLLISVV